MIHYINNLYVTDKTKNKVPKLIKAINKEKVLHKGFVIILSQTAEDVFDIIPYFSLKALNDNDMDITVLGFAESKKAAISLCAKMSSEYIGSGSEATMRQYFENM